MINKQETPPTIDPKALAAIYAKHFGDTPTDTPEKLLRDMLCCIIDFAELNSEELKGQVSNSLCLAAFFEEILAPIRCVHKVEREPPNHSLS